MVSMNDQKIPEKLLSGYLPTETESRIYSAWEESGYFNPDNLPGERNEAFSMVVPPPNVTGNLHAGHAIMLALQDTLTRYHRMNGKSTLWLPGTDHAAIATQSVVEKEIQKKEKKSRHDLGREELLRRINDFARSSQDTILSQFRSMGASLDWSRLAFTLDESKNVAVNTMFKKMYDDGLIYKGDRIVNWDPKGQTTISDDEVVKEERKSILYTFKYSADFPIAISTTRPETKVGDSAVAVHPDDERYVQYVGKEYNVTFCDVPLCIKIIADTAVEKDFGTGALGVTPSHSQIDWEIADRHDLPRKQVINEYAKMCNVENAELLGMKVSDARDYIVNWLTKENLIIKQEEVDQAVPTAERTGGIIEPLPKKQWFIAVNKEFEHFGSTTTLKKLMLDAISSGKTKITPERYERVYMNWIENLRDWCISRQIWYGHRVPVWYKLKSDPGTGGTAKVTGGSMEVDNNQANQRAFVNDTNMETFCGATPPGEIYTNVGFSTKAWKQDEDTLDTWFSSGMWTFSTLGWPNKTKDLEDFHPTSLLETGHDILFFWVARMVLFSTYALNQVPFKDVYLHGLIRDSQGRKMSKSIGNVLDPRDLSQKYGTDALRMSLIVGNGPGNDLKLSEEKIKGYRNFANKIWNATRFVLERTLDYTATDIPLIETDQALWDSWLQVKKDITNDLESYRLHLASEKIYSYFWHTFCDEIIESHKERIISDTNKASAQKLLLLLLEDHLRVLHPFMPFVTEEIWGLLGKKELLLIEPWNN
jgi:valyl-tRNA synthetase